MRYFAKKCWCVVFFSKKGLGNVEMKVMTLESMVITQPNECNAQISVGTPEQSNEDNDTNFGDVDDIDDNDDPYLNA